MKKPGVWLRMVAENLGTGVAERSESGAKDLNF